MGSEMCIRDRRGHLQGADQDLLGAQQLDLLQSRGRHLQDEVRLCLLYTSDAADERSSVDLGGRRIIKKKTHTTNIGLMI